MRTRPSPPLFYVSSLLFIAAFLGTSPKAHGQPSNPQIVYTASTPSGACGATQLRLLTPNGTLYSCQTGTWAAISGGGSSGSTITVSAYSSIPSCTGANTNTLYYTTDGYFTQQCNGSSYSYWFGTMPITPPAANASWTGVNLGTGTSADDHGAVNVTPQPRAELNYGGNFIALPAGTSYTVTVLLAISLFDSTGGGDDINGGFALRESGTGKLITFGRYSSKSSALNGVIWKLTNPTASSAATFLNFAAGNQIWFRVVRSGSTMTISYSADGHNFITALSETVSTFFTTAPDQVGFGCDAALAANFCSVTLLSKNP